MSLARSVGAWLALHAAAAASTTLTLTVNNPVCSASRPELNRCSINIRAVSAVASDSFARLEIAVDGKLRVVENGFFENTAYFDKRMLADGLTVVCGIDGEGGTAGFGRTRTVGITVYLYGSDPVSDQAVVSCPPAADTIYADNYEPGGAGY